MKRVFFAIVGFVLAMVAGAVAYAYSGAFDVSATTKDNPIVSWLLVTTRFRSVEVRVAEIQEPADMSDALMIWNGAVRYKDDCQVCHGAPEDYPGPTGRGMNPQPPKLFVADPTRPLSSKYYYWVIMHGIRMTGMPSWQHKYSDAEAWALTAFLLQFPKMSPQTYARLAAVWYPSAGRPNPGVEPNFLRIGAKIGS